MNTVEQRLLSAVNASEPTALVKRFSTLVRLSGTPEEREAVAYVIERLKAFGIPHLVHEPVCFISLPLAAELRVTGPAGWAIGAKTPAMSFSTGDTPVIGDVVYVPSAQARKISEIFGTGFAAGLDLQGKVLLTEGLPMPGKVAAARKAGAVGAIFIAPGDRIHEGICTDIWGAPDLDSYQRQPDLPVLAVNKPDGMALARACMTGRVTVELKTWLDTGWRPIPIIEAEISGTEHPEEFVLFHGHLDSWHVGIGDNATGNAALLETARVFWEHRAELKRSLKVIWWSGHSHGRYAGSTWYADQFGLELAERCVLHVNCDSPGCRWATDYSGAMFMAETAGLGRGAIRDVTGQEAAGQRPLRAGDCSFNNIGVSTCFMQLSWMPEALLKEKEYYSVGGNGGNIEWHAEDDGLHLYDPEVMVRDVQVLSLALLRALNGVVHPLDYRATVAEILAALDRYEADAGGRCDCGSARAEAQELLVDLDTFYADLGQADPRSANAALRAVGRLLVPLFYTRDGAFRHDHAVEVPPLADLVSALGLARIEPGSHLDYVTRTHLKRGLNRVTGTLRQARKELARL